MINDDNVDVYEVEPGPRWQEIKHLSKEVAKQKARLFFLLHGQVADETLIVTHFLGSGVWTTCKK